MTAVDPLLEATASAHGIDACDRCLALSELTARLGAVPVLRGTPEFDAAHPPPADPEAASTVQPLSAPLLSSAEGLAPVPGELVRAARGVSADRARELIARYRGWSADGLRAWCAEAEITAVCRCSTDYPASLHGLSDPPAVLFAVGRTRLLDRCPDRAIGMVGTRRPTRVGREAARTIASGIAQTGGIVVSGMALGVDGASHEGALAVRGTTIAVLASGVNRPTPPSHTALYERIRQNGAVVSELPPGTEPSKWSFPARNRIIAALSSAVIVVEAPLKSGALITVDHAHDLGVDVYAVPGSLASPSCSGSNRLLCDGAGGVVDGVDLMAMRAAVTDAPVVPAADGGAGIRPAHPDHALVHDALITGPRSRHEIAVSSSLDTGDLELALIDLELSGWVERAVDGRYRLVERRR